MARNITVTLDDGTQHVYQNAPDEITPEAVTARAQKDFGKKVTALDGGNTPSASSRALNATANAVPLVGVADAALSAGTGLAGQAVGGLAGLGATAASLVKGEGIDAAMVAGSDAVNQVSSAMTYKPRTETGKTIVGALGKVGEVLEAPAKYAGDKTLEVTGSPALATAVDTGVQGLVGLITGAAPKLVARGASAAAKGAGAATKAITAPMIDAVGGSGALADGLEAQAAKMPARSNMERRSAEIVQQLADQVRAAPAKEVPALLADFVMPDAGVPAAKGGARGAAATAAEDIIDSAPTVGKMAVDTGKGIAGSVLSGKSGLVRKAVDMVMPDADESVKYAVTAAAKTLGITKTLGVSGFGLALVDAATEMASKLKTASPQMGAGMLARRAKQIMKERESAPTSRADISMSDALAGSAGAQSSMRLSDAIGNE